jgi:hypothetical protein
MYVVQAVTGLHSLFADYCPNVVCDFSVRFAVHFSLALESTRHIIVLKSSLATAGRRLSKRRDVGRVVIRKR